MAGAYEFLSRGGFGGMNPAVRKPAEKGTYIRIPEYPTKDFGHFEAYRKCSDIQCIVKGREWIYVTPPEPEKR